MVPTRKHTHTHREDEHKTHSEGDRLRKTCVISSQIKCRHEVWLVTETEWTTNKGAIGIW